MDAIFGLRMMMEKWREGQKELYYVFIDLKKAYDRVPREELWECMHQAGVPECYVMSIQDMYKGVRTSVRSAVGLTRFRSESWPISGISAQPIPICYNHGHTYEGCEKRSSMGHDVCG